MTPIELKIAGELPNVPLTRLGDASVTPDQAKFAKEIREGCLNPFQADPEIINADPDDLSRAFGPLLAGRSDGMMNGPRGEDLPFSECVRELHRRHRLNEEQGWRVGWPNGTDCYPGEYPHPNSVAVKTYMDFDDYSKNNSLMRTATDDDIGGAVVEGGLFPQFPNVEAAKKFFVYTEETKHLAQRCGRRIGDKYIHLDMGMWAFVEGCRLTTGVWHWEQFDGFEGDHRIHIKMRDLPGYSGYAYPPDGSCTDHVTSTLDIFINFSGWWFPTLMEHETCGHSGGFPHIPGHRSDTTDSIMGYRNKRPYRSKDSHDRSLPLAREMYPNYPAIALNGQTPTDPTDPLPAGKVYWEDENGNLVSEPQIATRDGQLEITSYHRIEGDPNRRRFYSKRES